MKRILGGALGVLVVAAIACIPVHADEVFPSHPIELIIPWGPGGGSDQTGRIVAKLLEEQVKVPVTVMNIPGATGNIGMARLLSARPGGYTLALLAADTYATLVTAPPKWTLKDLVPLAVMMKQPSGLFAAGNGKLTSWADVVKAAAERPVTVATSGVGSPDEITINYLIARGLKLTAVPYAKPGERYAAILGGYVDLLYSPVGNIKSYVDAGQMRPVLVLNKDRLEGYAQTPTSREAGYDVLLPQFRAIVVREGTDPARVKFLQDALVRVFGQPDYKKYLADSTGSPDSLEVGAKAVVFMQGELDAMKAVVSKSSR